MIASSMRARAAASAALLLPVLLLCGPFLFTSLPLAGRDFQSGYQPLYELVREAWARDGELPRWNPRHFAGIPCVGNPQTALSYPPNGLFLNAPLQVAFEALVFAHLLLAAGGFYRWMRGFGLRRDAAVLGGLAYALSAATLGRVDAGHYPYLVTICLAPLLLHRVRSAILKASASRSAALAGVTALVLTGGSPQFILHLVIVAAGLTLWTLFGTRPWKPAAASLAGGVALGAALSALHLLPAAAMAAESSRSAGSAEAFRAMSEPFGEFNASYLVGFLVPTFPWKQGANLWLWHEKALYVGVLPLLLAGIACRRPLSGPARFFLVCFAAALLAALGGAALIPGFSRFRVPERVVWVAVLSLAALAAIGWDALMRGGLEGDVRKRFLRGAAGFGVVAGIALLVGPRAPVEASIFLATFAAALAVVAWPKARGFSVALLALDLCGHGLLILRVHSEDDAAAPLYARFVGDRREQARVLDLTDFHLGPSAQGFNLLRAGGYPVPDRLCRYYARAWKETTPHIETLPEGRSLIDPEILRRLNVRWIYSREELSVPSWRILARDSAGVLYEAPDASGADFLEGTTGSIARSRPSSNRIRVSVTAAAPGRLVLSEMYSTGWEATRDGVPAAIAAWEDTLLSLDVPAGTSTWEFRYAPAPWRIGRGISALAALGFAALVLGGRLQTRRAA